MSLPGSVTRHHCTACPHAAGTLGGRGCRTPAHPALVGPQLRSDVVSSSADTTTDDDELRAADGRVPGRRGLATRQRLLDQTAEMLRSGSYRDLKVVDIARGAGTSPATFYQYFPDVEAAVLALAQEMSLEGAELSGHVRDRPWKGRAGYATSLELVDAVLEFWERNRAVLRVVDLATEEGDMRFRQIRTRLLNELTVALSEVVVKVRSEKRSVADDTDPMAVAGVLVSMLAHVAAHRWGFEFWGIRTGDTRTAMGRIVFTTITGQKPPVER
ncbi:MAG: TetR/AcrR family transcriptional regulator [Acidimicrobiia bacterium]|nr:TetR/AcrR family transcriptional regulator [Acidimicrobiia bacterium]